MPRFPGIPGSGTPGAIASGADAIARLKAMKAEREAEQRRTVLAAIGIGANAIGDIGGIATDIYGINQAGERNQADISSREGISARDIEAGQSEGVLNRASELERARISAAASRGGGPMGDLLGLKAMKVSESPFLSPAEREAASQATVMGDPDPTAPRRQGLERASELLAPYAQRLRLNPQNPFEATGIQRLERGDVLALIGALSEQTQDPEILDLAMAEIMKGTGGGLPRGGFIEQLTGGQAEGIGDLLSSIGSAPESRAPRAELEALFRALQPSEPDPHGGGRAPVPRLTPGTRDYIRRRIGQ